MHCACSDSPFCKDDKSWIEGREERKQLVQGHSEVVGEIIGCLKFLIKKKI